MKKLFSVILLTMLLTSVFAQSFPAMAAPECKKYEITIPEGTAFSHYPVYKDDEGNDYKIRYRWSKDAVDEETGLPVLGDHTYVISVKEETWVSVEEYTIHVVPADQLPECTRDESKIDFGLHRLPLINFDWKSIDWLKVGLIGGGIIILAAAVIIIICLPKISHNVAKIEKEQGKKEKEEGLQ